jgi:hypothetical protein
VTRRSDLRVAVLRETSTSARRPSLASIDDGVFSLLSNETLGNNAFGQPLPIVTDDAEPAFAVLVIPMDDKLAIKAAVNQRGLERVTKPA